MSFNELAKKRISCRNYEKKDIPKEYIRKLLDAAHNAPSAGNIQPCYFYVIVEQNVIKGLQGKLYTQEWIANAPVLIIACTNQNASGNHYGERGKNIYAYMDCAAAIENLLLCATDLGLASCWIGDFDVSKCKEFIQRIEHTPVALITVGYAKGTLVKAHKKTLTESYSIIGTNILGSIEEEDSSFEMRHCDISNAVFEDVNLHQCSIENANMYQAKFSNINMKEATISFSNLEGVQIVNCLVDGLTINGKKVEVE